MQRTLGGFNSPNGGPLCVALGLRGSNTVFINNFDANNDVYLCHSRIVATIPRSDGGIQGFKIAKATVQTIQDWVGDLFAVGSAEGTTCDIEVTYK